MQDSSPDMNWSLNGASNNFPSPYADYASTVMPTTISEALRWCEFIALNNGTYASALDRIVSYFLTSVESADDELGDDEKTRWLEYLETDFHARTAIKEASRNGLIYGNYFYSVLQPIVRYLRCKGCNKEERTLRHIHDNSQYRYSWANYEFHAQCPSCGYYGPWMRTERPATHEPLKSKFWNPHDIDIIEDEYSGKRRYIWRIPEQYRRFVRDGAIHVLEHVDWSVVDCIQKNMHLEFSDGFVFHFREPSLAGQRTGGWGYSRVLSNFRHAWYVQVLHRFNETLAMEYIVPFRVISPPDGSKVDAEGLDPTNTIDLGGFSSNIESIVRRHRQRPGGYHVSPYSVNYQLLGGEAKQLVPFELIELAERVLLSNIGVPFEMHQGTLAVQAATPALRLFEAVWQHLVQANNDLLRFMVQKISKYHSWQPISLRMARVTVVDDLNDQMLKMQLVQNQMVSASTALSSLNLDYKSELRRIMEEKRYASEQEARQQREMDAAAIGEQMTQPVDPAAQQQGVPAPGGSAPAPGGAAPAGPAGQAAQSNAVSTPIGPNDRITPQELQSRAQTEAQRMMSMTEGQRQGEMMKLKQRDWTMWMAVSAVTKDIQSQAASQGKQQVLAEKFGTPQ